MMRRLFGRARIISANKGRVPRAVHLIYPLETCGSGSKATYEVKPVVHCGKRQAVLPTTGSSFTDAARCAFPARGGDHGL